MLIDEGQMADVFNDVFGIIRIRRKSTGLPRSTSCWECEVARLLRRERGGPAAKRSAGVVTSWLGLRFFSTLGVVVIPEDKRMRALHALRQALSGSLSVQDFLSLRGRLIHLRTFLGVHRAELYQLFAIQVAWRSLAATIPAADFDVACLQRWHDVLARTAGICCSSVLSLASRPLLARDCQLARLAMFVDAAQSEDPASSCFGVFVHGAWASVSVPVVLHFGPTAVSISVLELLAVGVGLLIAHHNIGSLPLLLSTDSLHGVEYIFLEGSK